MNLFQIDKEKKTEFPTQLVRTSNVKFCCYYIYQKKKKNRNGETLVHLMKSSIGNGVLALPYVFALCGFIPAIIASGVTMFITTHCSYIFVRTTVIHFV